MVMDVGPVQVKIKLMN